MTDHYLKWILKSILGFALIAAGIVFIYYSLTQLNNESRWALYAVATSLVICSGVFLICSAFIHKLKSELRKRQKGHNKEENY